jgi:hypothetical protein
VFQKIEHVLVEVIVSYIKYIHLTLEGDAFLGHSKPGMSPNIESNPYRSELPTGNPSRHRWKGEGAHVHTR